MMYRHTKSVDLELLIYKTKSAINAILICPKPTQERPIAQRFSQDIFPSSVGINRKGSEKFAIVQIFQLKVYGLKFIVKDLPEWDSSCTP